MLLPLAVNVSACVCVWGGGGGLNPHMYPVPLARAPNSKLV